MRRSVRCPKCGHRLLDCEHDTELLVCTVEKRNRTRCYSPSRIAPNIFTKCGKCGAEIGLRQVFTANLLDTEHGASAR